MESGTIGPSISCKIAIYERYISFNITDGEKIHKPHIPDNESRKYISHTSHKMEKYIRDTDVRGSPNPWVTSTKTVTSCDIYFIKKLQYAASNAAIPSF